MPSKCLSTSAVTSTCETVQQSVACSVSVSVTGLASLTTCWLAEALCVCVIIIQ